MPNLYELTAKLFVAENRTLDQVAKRANDLAEKLGEYAREKFLQALFAELHRG